jgi:hypothetical protein
MSGREVGDMLNAEKPAGSYILNYDASKLVSGFYYCRIVATGGEKNFIQTMKITKIN